MATVVLVVLLVLSAVVLLASFALLVTVGEKQLHTPLAIAHDGPRAGRPAPRLQGSALDGGTIDVPAGRRQVLLFTDHSLLDFDDLLVFLTTDSPDRPEVVVVGSANRTSAVLLDGLRLRVPATVVPHQVYDSYRIRVMPYAVVVDEAGRVTTSGLVNTPFQLRHLAQVGLDSEPAGSASTPRGASS